MSFNLVQIFPQYCKWSSVEVALVVVSLVELVIVAVVVANKYHVLCHLLQVQSEYTKSFMSLRSSDNPYTHKVFNLAQHSSQHPLKGTPKCPLSFSKEKFKHG